jgi:hypothetical protein
MSQNQYNVCDVYALYLCTSYLYDTIKVQISQECLTLTALLTIKKISFTHLKHNEFQGVHRKNF